mgnify:CR=1 FL=1
MNEHEMNQDHFGDHSAPGMNQTFCPCPFCGGTELDINQWSLDEGEVDAVECRQCYAGAPVAAWQRRPDPWRYAPDLPGIGQRVLLTYRSAGGESPPICMRYQGDPEGTWPTVRWMPIP